MEKPSKKWIPSKRKKMFSERNESLRNKLFSLFFCLCISLVHLNSPCECTLEGLVLFSLEELKVVRFFFPLWVPKMKIINEHLNVTPYSLVFFGILRQNDYNCCFAQMVSIQNVPFTAKKSVIC